MKAKLCVLLAAFLGIFSPSLLAGNLKVNLTPTQAVTAGAQWRVDGGSWRTSGTTVNGLSNGTHQVSFSAANGWIAPAASNVSVVNGTTTLSFAYVQASSLKITLTPSTGKWRIDGGAWQNSAATAANLTSGSHTIDYQALSGYAAPTTESVTLTAGQLTSLNRSYTQLASLKVTLTPSNGTWRVDGGAWQTSAATVANLTPGSHTVDYQALSGYTAPASESVTLTSGQLTSLNRSYVPLASLTVTLTPGSGQWRIDGGAWRASGTTATNLSVGSHTIDYSTLTNYSSPASEAVTLAAGQSLSLSRSYIQLAQILIGLVPSEGRWRANGGAWQASGTSLMVPPGNYTIDYEPLPLYDSPANDVITLAAGGLFATTRSYVSQKPSLRIDLNPGTGQWRVDGGAWRASGATLAGLDAGSHAIDYSDVGGDFDVLASETVTLALRQNAVLSRTYPFKRASLSITLTPSSGTWYLDGSGPKASGETVSGITPGNHQVQYGPVTNYNPPTYEYVSLTPGQSASLSRNYTPLPATLIITTNLPAGQWRASPVGGPAGTWNANGAALSLAPGDYTVEYLPVATYAAPAAETLTLSPFQYVSNSRSYTLLPGSLTVTLTPAAGQWQVDGGAWQSSGTTLDGLTAGNHTVTYGALGTYITPPAETVEILPGSTATLARSYGEYASLTVHATPSSATRVGAAKWRVDGGAWHAAETAASVTAGTHSVEYQPVAGWIVPAAASVTIAGGDNAQLTAEYFPVHRLRFFLHQNLVGSLTPTELQYRIAQYAAHIQTIFHRETVRRLTFDPANDITICTASPFSNSYSGTPPEVGFEVWAYVQLTDNPSYGTYGGNGTLDQSGAGGGTNLRWDTIYDPSTLQDDTPQLRQYWTQIDHVVHEFEHTFGAGIGEYYSPGNLMDPTTVDPIAPLTSFGMPDPADHFWGSRSEYWTDPLTGLIYDGWRAGNPKSLPALLATTSFAPATKAVIADLHRFSSLATIPDMSAVKVTVVDAITGQPIPEATVRVWNRRNYNSTTFEHPVTAGATPGTFTFTWHPYPNTALFSNYDNMKLLKAWAPGYAPKAQWEWIYDAMKVKLVNGSNTFEITIALTPQ